MRILLIEDDARLGYLIHYKLNQCGHHADWAHQLEEAEAFLALGSYDMYILDWMLPEKSGIEWCRERRASGDTTAILMLTARDTVEDRVEGLLAGADDYLVKPFAFEELLARLVALDRRRQAAGYTNLLSAGDIAIDEQSQQAFRNGEEIYLTKREFQLLSFMIRHAGKVLSRERILHYVWGSDTDVTFNTIDATVKLLRKKIDDPFQAKVIQNVRGRGYRLAGAGEGQDD
jgi:DNA-binding response OmpR family regulator